MHLWRILGASALRRSRCNCNNTYRTCRSRQLIRFELNFRILSSVLVREDTFSFNTKIPCSGSCGMPRRPRSSDWQWIGWGRRQWRRGRPRVAEPATRRGCWAAERRAGRRRRSPDGRPGAAPACRRGADAAAAAGRRRRHDACGCGRAGLDRPRGRAGRCRRAQRGRRGAAESHGSASQPAGSWRRCAPNPLAALPPNPHPAGVA